MAASLDKLTKLEALKTLAEEIKRQFASKNDFSMLEGKINTIEQLGAEENVINEIKVNDVKQEPIDKSINITVPTKTSELSNDSKFQTEEQIKAKISAVYKPGGSSLFTTLPIASSDNLGVVYNITDSFTSNEKFISGEEGKLYPAGTNVVVVQVDNDYKYDVLSGMVDLTNYVKSNDLTTELSKKVDKEIGKKLSTNDYTNEDKEKLANIDIATNEEVTEIIQSVFADG